MRLRHQLIIINLLCHGIMIAALIVCYVQMVLTFEQVRFFISIAFIAVLVSIIAYWLMTLPIQKSIEQLMRVTNQISRRDFSEIRVSERGPQEFRDLEVAFTQMGRKLNQSFQQLEDGERARRELIANVSHDLRTPIAVVQSMLEALQDDLIKDQETRERYFTTSLKEIERLSSLIHDLFELSKLEAGQERFEPIRADLESILLEVLDAHTVVIQEKKIDLQVKVPEQLPFLYMMPNKIIRVIGNLLQNAIRHSPPNGIIQILIQMYESEQKIEVVVRDEGEGVAITDQDRIFERFYRTDLSRNKESGGSGLGLAIAKSVVELHGGEIGVRKPENQRQGSEFWFTIPLA
ncbi:sensor histidine kinase [Hazenella sp. IB182353]|uniref:sensor histidine kinase n=1 Tax=Polycladospora coralii TaxID=2771432 RepID=UPI0017472730|nr:ATP-binding protein [Polycladospora coralii]MBS7529582.1 sensor histidine kinase [Polycladospora coralii]